MAAREAQAVLVAERAQGQQARGVVRRRGVRARERVARVAVELDVADVLGLQPREDALQTRGVVVGAGGATQFAVGGAGAAGQVISPAPLLR